MKILKRIMAGLASGIVIVGSINVQAQSNINTLPLINPDIMEDSVNDVSDVIINITDNIDIQPEKTESSYVYAQEPESYTQVYYSEPVYEEKSLTLTYDEFMSMYGDKLISEEPETVLMPTDTSSEQAAYDKALANYNMALAEYETAVQMVETTKEIEVEITEEVTDEEGNVSEITRTEIQTVTEMIPAGDVVAAQASLDTASAVLDSASQALETAQSQTTTVEQPKMEDTVPIPTTIVEPEQEQQVIADDVVVKEEVTQATSGTCGDNLTWTLDDEGLLNISGEGEMTNFNSTGPWGTTVTGVIIENGVTRIGASSFKGCSSLKSIIIPESVTSIGYSAFDYCASLEHIIIPTSVTTMAVTENPGGGYTFGSIFRECSKLQTAGPIGSGCDIEFGWIGAIPESAFYYANCLTSIIIPNTITEIGQRAFAHCKGLSDIVFPESVSQIQMEAFQYCTGLQKVIIPKTVSAFHNYVFFGCDQLKDAGPIGSGCSIEFGWEDEIPDHVFCGCESITSIHIPDSIKRIGEWSFQGCTHLTDILLPVDVTDIGEYAFHNCVSLTNINIPENITGINRYTFYGCEALSNINLSDSISHIGDAAFLGCAELKDINIPESVTSIGNGAFSRCTGFTNIVVPDSVTSIGNSAFYGCNNLTKIIIPGSVTKMGGVVFYDCPKLKSAGPIGSGCNIEFGWDYSFPARAFWGTGSLTSIIIPNGIKAINEYTFYDCSSLQSIELPETVNYIGSCAMAECSSLTNVTISGNETYIGDEALSGCTNLKTAGPIGSGCNIELGWSNSVPYRAFVSCSNLTSVILPDGITIIGNNAFEGCTLLKNIYIPESVTTIGDSAFYRCSKLKTAGPEGSNTNIVFGWKEIIPELGFGKNNFLTTVFIPNSIKQIGSLAFEGCSKLDSIYYIGNQTEWNEVVLGDENVIPSTAVMYYLYVNNSQYDIHSNCDIGIDFKMEFSNDLLSYEGAKVEFNIEGETISKLINEAIISDNFYCFVLEPAQLKTESSITVNVLLPENIVINCATYYLNEYCETNNITFGKCGDNLSWMKKDNALVLSGAGNMYDYSEGSRPWGTDITDVLIGGNVTGIGAQAFYECKGLKTITIPSKVTSIKDDAFAGCSSLTDIYYEGNKQDWVSNTLYNFDETVTIHFKDINVASISLNEYDLILTIGSQYQLHATVQPKDAYNTKVTWMSSDTSIVSVIDGMITAIGNGIATITAISEEGCFSTTCEVTVNVPVEGISLDKASLTLNKGENAIIIATVSPADASNKNVFWTSSDNSVASVKDGMITALRAGNTVITAATKDGRLSAACNVSVIGLPFTDVPRNAWYYSTVKECYETGLINGTSATTFSPMQEMTRAMVVTILWRMEGQPKTAFNNKFKDVSSKQWYAQAISWAVNNGVVNGYGDGTFKPDAAVTREQVAVMLANYATYKKVYKPGTKKLNTYPDGSQVSTWAQQGMKWALTNGIISGDGAGYLHPKKSATRAEGAAMLLRMKNWL